jgi:hypothetical protein
MDISAFAVAITPEAYFWQSTGRERSRLVVRTFYSPNPLRSRDIVELGLSGTARLWHSAVGACAVRYYGSREKPAVSAPLGSKK